MTIRSYLYAPGNRPDLLGKVLGKGADAVILDLEDAVPPAEKAKARGIVSDFLASMTGATLLVRLNGGADALADLDGLTVRGLHGVLLPKAEDAELIRAIDRLLAAREEAAAVPPGSVIVQPLIESVAGLYALDAMAAASPRIRRFAFGAGDFVRDLRAEPTPARVETLYARQHLVARSRFLRLEAPVAHVFMPVRDLDALRRACEEDRALGFHGRSCIHPAQVPIVNDVFQHGAEDIAWARTILAAYADAMREGRGALVLDDGTFVDEAIAARARDILAGA